MSDPRNPRSHKDNRRGLDGEDYVARRFELEECPENDWCDLVNPRTGTQWEVKVCQPNRRFRLWEDNHRSLTASDGQKTAWYYFIVVSKNGNIVDTQKRKPSTITRIVRERGGWNESGHERGSRQHKLPPSAVMTSLNV